MALSDNDRLQEMALVASENVARVGKNWWYALAIAIVAVVPAYYLFKFGFVSLLMKSYSQPAIIYTEAKKEPLQVMESKIIPLSNGTYSSYIRIRNINLEWGAKTQHYTAEYKTLGGTVVKKIEGTIFVLPAKEKIIVFRSFSSDEKPDKIEVTLDETHFIHKPEIDFNPELERTTLLNPPGGMSVYAGIKNNTAFTLKEIILPVLVYNNQNQIVAVNYTTINDVRSGETRTFQYSWPSGVTGAVRAEIYPEINIFDSDVFQVPQGVSPIDR